MSRCLWYPAVAEPGTIGAVQRRRFMISNFKAKAKKPNKFKSKNVNSHLALKEASYKQFHSINLCKMLKYNLLTLKK